MGQRTGHLHQRRTRLERLDENGRIHRGVQAHFDLIATEQGSNASTCIATLKVSGNGYNGTGPMTFVIDGDRITTLTIAA